ncbi:DUF192 domain-containing protein [Halopiger aswanensis]|uniref:DUF192 domain-containing protein n=1 Tax=Halopiger aswanensis TaxID=148449 RepID=A0A3R7FUA1_9EURY|nr:DUF192 domain-containing protein [Halopiger aswanensis]RKD93556.1 hypothetical protein ATJ93_3186 [Halopiger aswanensis]
MTDVWSRRHLLAVAGTVAAAGCLDAIGSGASSDETENSTDGTDGTDGTGGEESESTSGDGDSGGNESSDENGTETDGDGESSIHGDYDYETTEVAVVTPEGDELGSVTAAIADTSELRYLGLSDTEELPEDRGMLFVYESVEERTFVMREMDFGIDIIYADAGGEITSIHHAPAPEPGEDGESEAHQYPGEGQYVLEVAYEWTTERDVSEGDVLEFDLDQ